MFCPSCGAESPIELNYCNRCGANLNALVAAQSVAPVSVFKPTLVIGLVMLFITLGGFAGVFSTAVDLSTQAGNKDVPMAVIFFGMVTIIIIDALLFTLLVKLVNAALSSNKIMKPAKKPTQPQLPQPTTARLQPGASVTENTTRFFEPYAAASPVEPVPIRNRSDK